MPIQAHADIRHLGQDEFGRIAYAVQQHIDIVAGNHRLGRQRVRLAAPGCAFKVTTIAEAEVPYFEDHARRFLRHTELRSIHWINVTREIVRFQAFEKK